MKVIEFSYSFLIKDPTAIRMLNEIDITVVVNQNYHVFLAATEQVERFAKSGRPSATFGNCIYGFKIKALK